MKRKIGFTLVELMVVVLIVAILAAVAIPIMRGKIDEAKWSEGKAMMGTIGSSVRAHVALKNEAFTNADKVALSYVEMGLAESDFNGTYFDSSLFDWDVTYDLQTNALAFVITATAPDTINSPTTVTLDQSGNWATP